MKIILVLFITLFSFFSTLTYADTQAETGSVAATVASNLTDEILKPLYEDLNTPGYIANLHKLYENANKGKDKELFISACKFIGLFNEDKAQWEKYKKDNALISETEINSKIDLRNKARANKDYNEADRIRDELLDKGVLIEDKDGKTLWKFK